MVPPADFLPCAACGCHARPDEPECPHCGARLRRPDGSVPRTAAALLLGLTAVAIPIAPTGGCGSDVTAPRAAGAGDTGDGTGGAAGVGGMGGIGGRMGVDSSMAAAYGTVSSVSTATVAPPYGVPQTDADMDGYFDQQEGGDDCDDMDPNVHPGAPEKPGDGKDSNCDGSDDT